MNASAQSSITETGLIHAYLIDGKGGGQPLDWQDIQQWSAEQGKIWLHFDYTETATREWMEAESGLEQVVIEALLNEDTRPRTTEINDGLLITLRGVNNNSGADPEDMVSIRLWCEENRIISTRKRKLLSVADLLKQFQKGKGPKDVGEFIVFLSDRLVWRMISTIDELEDQIDDIEDRVLNEEPAELRHELSEIRREIISLRRYLSPEREAISRLAVEQVDWIHDHHRLKIREISERLIQHIEDINVVRERTAVMNEELLSRLSEQLNKRMYVLSILSAIFLPLGFLTGLLGVNVGGIPGAQSATAFWGFVGILAVVVMMQLWILRWKKWL